jgi:acetate kinase
MDTVLVVNAGSSSVKFQIFSVEGAGEPRRLIKGQMDGIGVHPKLHAKSGDSPIIDKEFGPSEIPDIPAAIDTIAEWLRRTQPFTLTAVGHRVVHGGPLFDKPVIVDQQIVEQLQQYVPLAPLHQPNNLAPIRLLLDRRPELPQVVCFDTAFHRGHSAVAERFALPERYYADGIRRYGFHGLSYEYVAMRMREVAPDIAAGRVIVAHLGSGASMCAMLAGRSIETTMGFTALDGLPMGTRSGQIDPGVLLHLITQRGLNAKEVQDLLYFESGLKGLSGISNDVRELEASPEPAAALAIEYFIYRIGLLAGMMAAALGGIDAFVFTAGIGENSASIRARIAEKLGWLGAEIDPAANTAGKLVVSATESSVKLCVVPTDEELAIARHTISLLV